MNLVRSALMVGLITPMHADYVMRCMTVVCSRREQPRHKSFQAISINNITIAKEDGTRRIVIVSVTVPYMENQHLSTGAGARGCRVRPKICLGQARHVLIISELKLKRNMIRWTLQLKGKEWL